MAIKHTYSNDAGIDSIGLAFPSLALPVEELARVRGIDPGKFTVGLGCRTIALCDTGESVVDIAEQAARRALDRWDGSIEDIGMIVVGTETAQDMSRPLSAWVADRLGLKGAVRSYEVKHACYGGTLALRQALEWKWSGASNGKAALVIASDVALYGENDGGEPTQGAGAVAFVIDKPTIASVSRESYAWSEPAFDFWRPVGEDYPRVEGKFSVDCYNDATANCFDQFLDGAEAESTLADYKAVCMHVPFPKMVRKGVNRLGEVSGWDPDKTSDIYDSLVDPSMEWNREVGNCYTASLWIAVAHALNGLDQGREIVAFSYGSGFGAELMTLQAGSGAAAGQWVDDVESDFTGRRQITGEEYLELRSRGKAPVVDADKIAANM